MDEWPSFLSDIKNYSPIVGEYFLVSEISTEDYCEHILTPALISQDDLAKLNPSEIGYMVTGTGPHPSYRIDEYRPLFWIHSPEEIYLEPLILQWESANKTILWPAQGFLMTYGLFPRLIELNQEIIWDEPSEPLPEVIRLKAISNYHRGNASLAQIKIRKDYIKDYSTLRKKVIIQLFFEEMRIKINEEIKKLIGDNLEYEAKYKTHCIRIIVDSRDENIALVEIRGFRVLATPGESPITKGRWEYGSLKWPGIDKPITDESSRSLTRIDLVYISDSVLAKYEGHKDYDITPETGGVSYGNQWAVSNCHRVGRNTIALELKKLYEGNGPEVVNHWHKHSVDPSTIDRSGKNIAEYAKELVDEYLRLGETLATISSTILEEGVGIEDVIKLDKRKIDYSGWCSIKEIEGITWHIPENLNKDEFLERCKRLNILIIEGLNEGLLRRTLLKVGVESNNIKEYRSVKLLELLIEIFIVSNKSGLSPKKNGKTIVGRIDYENTNEFLRQMFGLNFLRIQSSHSSGTKGEKIFYDALKSFGIEQAMIATNYVDAIEIVYQGIANTLKTINKILEETIS
jgi:hypothetical protein